MLLTAEWLLPITSEPLTRGAVVVSGDKIEAVGLFDDLQRQYPNEEVRDFGRAILMPGLVNVHSHLDYSAMRGLLDPYPFFDWIIILTRLRLTLSHEDMVTSALWGTVESVRSGITTVADAGETGASLEAMSQAGLRGVFYQEIFGMAPAQIPPALAQLTERLEEFEATKGERIQLGISPHAPYTVSAELFHRVGELSINRSYPLCIHIAESPEEMNFFQNNAGRLADFVRLQGGEWNVSGTTPVKYLADIGVLDYKPHLAHCVQTSEDDIRLIAEHGASIAHCPKSNCKFGHGIAPLSDFVRLGARTGLGTDGSASNNAMDMFDEMRIALYLQRGRLAEFPVLTEQQMVELATIRGAETLGYESITGSLDPGKQADIIAVDISLIHNYPAYDPYSALVYSANQDDVLFTMVGGQVLYENGRVLTIDENEIRSRVDKVAEHLKTISPSDRWTGGALSSDGAGE